MTAANAMEPRRAKIPRCGSLVWVQGLACGALLTFATPTALLLGILFAPVIVCLLASAGDDSNVLRAVATSCAALSVGPVWHVWMAGGHMDAVGAVLATPSTLCLAWGAGAGAWALCQVLPILFSVAWELRETQKAKAIQLELDALKEEWGLTDADQA